MRALCHVDKCPLMKKTHGSNGLGKKSWKKDSHSGIKATIDVSILNLAFLLFFTAEKPSHTQTSVVH